MHESHIRIRNEIVFVIEQSKILRSKNAHLSLKEIVQFYLCVCPFVLEHLHEAYQSELADLIVLAIDGVHSIEHILNWHALQTKWSAPQ